MPHVRTRPLSDLAVIYLAMAHSVDGGLTSAKIDAIIENLVGRYRHADRTVVQEMVLETSMAHPDAETLRRAALNAAAELRDVLSPAQREAVLADLKRIARIDGLVVDQERSLLRALAECWGLPLSPVPAAATLHGDVPDLNAWTTIHELALIYLVLAHGTDSDLSGAERQVMLNRLQEWRPDLTGGQVLTILDRAMERYAEGADEHMLADAIHAVKVDLPEGKRMAALRDLIQIANADGVFLDSEEDLINELMGAWNVEPYANYGEHGRKE